MPKKILKNVLPWLVAAALLFYLFTKVPPEQVLRSLHHLHLPSFLGFGVVYFLIILALDTWVLSGVLSRFAAPVSFRELLPARCVSYLLALLNYNAGQAGMAVYLKRTRGLSFFKTLGCIFFVTVVDLYWVIAMAFAGSFLMDIHLQGFQLQDWVRRVAGIALIAFVLHLAFWRGWFGKILPARLHFGIGDWLRGKHLFQPFHHATVADYFKIALARFPIHAAIVSSLWFLIRFAGGTVSFRDVVATVPIVLLVGTIPLTPGGLGATQLALVELLKDHVVPPPAAHGSVGAAELLLAVSLTWMMLNYLLKALAGLIFLRGGSRELFQEGPDAAPH